LRDINCILLCQPNKNQLTHSYRILWQSFFSAISMNDSDVFNPFYIGIAAGIFTAASLLPQLIKIIREKKAETISFGMLLILLAGLGLWISYGILTNDMPLIITNSLSLVINVLIIIFSVKYKTQK
jgi:MtN3 and saliva related transmembrane protein